MESFPNPLNKNETILTSDHDAVERVGRQLYEEKVREIFERTHLGQVVAIDLKTGDHAVARDELEAIQELQSRNPGMFAWMQLVGKETVLASNLGAVRLAGRED